MDQNISAYMINICNKKWWWPLFRFCIDLAVINEYQLYCLQPLHPGQRAIDLLGFWREIVQVYCSKYRNVEKILPNIFPATRNHQKVIPDIRYDNESHWISKGAVSIVPKQVYTFVKNVMLDFTQSVSKVFILSNIYTFIFHFLAYYTYFFCIYYMFFLQG